MSADAAFLASVAAAPRSPTARLVYADWLDEQSAPRAEYLRLLCAAAGWAECPDRAVAVARLQELRPAFDADWLGAVQRGVGWRLLFEANLRPGGVGEHGVRYKFGPPATPEEIAEAGARLGFRLPAAVREMVAEFNGVLRFDRCDRLLGCALFSADGMADIAQATRVRVRTKRGDEIGPGKIVFVGSEYGAASLVAICVEDIDGRRAGEIVSWEDDGNGLDSAYPSLEEFIRLGYK